MKKKNLWFVLPALLLVFSMAFMSCGDGGSSDDKDDKNTDGGTPSYPSYPSGPSGPSITSETWKTDDGMVLKLNSDNSIYVTQNDKDYMQGTYTISGNSITINITRVHGRSLNESLEETGEEGPTFENTWYTKDQIITAYKSWIKKQDPDLSEDDISDMLDEISAHLDEIFTPMTGTINGNTLTLDDMTFTKDQLSGGGDTAITITTTSLPSGTVNTAYSQTLTATGDTPITWSRDSGTLPNGLSLSSSGTIS